MNNSSMIFCQHTCDTFIYLFYHILFIFIYLITYFYHKSFVVQEPRESQRNSRTEILFS